MDSPLRSAMAEALRWCEADRDDEDGHPSQDMLEARCEVLEEALARPDPSQDALSFVADFKRMVDNGALEPRVATSGFAKLCADACRILGEGA